MMAGHSDGEEDQFFDTRDEIASVADFDSDSNGDCCSTSGLRSCDAEDPWYEVWTKSPESILERRRRFLNWMGISLDRDSVEREELRYNETKLGIDRITENSGAVLRNSKLEDQFLSTRSYLLASLKEDAGCLKDDTSENHTRKVNHLDEEREFVMEENSDNQILSRSLEVGSNPLASASLVQDFMQKEADAGKIVDKKKKVKMGWLRKLNVLAHRATEHGAPNLKLSDFNRKVGARNHRVQVHLHRKRSKELSSLYAGQQILAHEGSISTMKFSPDGQCLASAGEDGIVRVWKVIEDERPHTFDIQDTDPSCLFFSVNHLSKLDPLDVTKDGIAKTRRLRKPSESACVIFPPKVFRILEKPLHEFRGHSGKVLALSWSRNGYLLSSSVDKTVRLWQMGRAQCLKIFCHNNYVTCVEFNPMDDNHFISGSIDGKVRIWEVHGCRVVDWTDIREIVTAACYSPNGKGGIVGSMDGNCRFFDIKDNCLQLDAQISLQGKKKLPCRRITGFQFSPSDPSKVMVTSADSQVRILSGSNVICKFKGVRNPGTLVPASFTSDGKHVVWSSEDSNVNVWNYSEKTSSRSQNIWSCESFSSNNASIAIPWCGMKTMSESPKTPTFVRDYMLGSILRNDKGDEDLHHKIPLLPPDCFSLGRGFFLESLPKSSATWPEEKLARSTPNAPSPRLCKSEYKFLKSAFQNTSNSPHLWGLVIVTAGWDGRITTYYNYGLPLRH